MDTKELVELARKLSAQIDPTFVGGRDANLLNKLADAIERLERERDEQRECKEHARKCCAEATAEATTFRARLAKMEEALRAIDAKVVELGLAAQRKANGHKHEKFAAVRQSMRLIVRTALTEEQP